MKREAQFPSWGCASSLGSTEEGIGEFRVAPWTYNIGLTPAREAS